MSARIAELSVGDSARIVGYEQGASSYRKRLLSMGLTKGTTITVRKRAPFGDPVELAVRGFSLSLRRSEAELLLLELEPGSGGGGGGGGGRKRMRRKRGCCNGHGHRST